MHLQTHRDIFRCRSIDFIIVAQSDGRKRNIPDWVVVRFDCCNCWCRLKTGPN